MTMVQVLIGWEFPIKLLCFPDGTLQLSPFRRVGVIFDQMPGGVQGVFKDDGFTLHDATNDPMEYEYNCPYSYKDMPLLKAWLVQQTLVSPIEIK